MNRPSVDGTPVICTDGAGTRIIDRPVGATPAETAARSVVLQQPKLCGVPHSMQWSRGLLPMREAVPGIPGRGALAPQAHPTAAQPE